MLRRRIGIVPPGVLECLKVLLTKLFAAVRALRDSFGLSTDFACHISPLSLPIGICPVGLSVLKAFLVLTLLERYQTGFGPEENRTRFCLRLLPFQPWPSRRPPVY